jgi:hypothetical protein
MKLKGEGAHKLTVAVMFNITSQDFLAKLEADYADFKAQPDSARHALNCIITAYHLYEWVWGDWLKTDHVTWGKLSIRGRETFKDWLYSNCPGFAVMESLTNGAKHFVRKTNPETQHVSGYGCGPYGVGPYGRPYLLIDYGADKSERWQTAEQVIGEAVTFWRDFFSKYRSVLTATVG